MEKVAVCYYQGRISKKKKNLQTVMKWTKNLTALEPE
jgi:hypothetical protein